LTFHIMKSRDQTSVLLSVLCTAVLATLVCKNCPPPTQSGTFEPIPIRFTILT
jgi:hypothetical protein